MLKNILLVVVTCLLLLGGTGYGQSSVNKPQKSMMYSCEAAPFLSVSVSTPKRNSLPRVQIKLMDPLSRAQGVNVSGRHIPESHYEDVVVAPKAPDHSRQHAVEVCGAAQGEYALTVYEHSDELYRIDVGVDVREFLSATLQSHEGRIRQYKFRVTVKKGQVDLTWLDKNGQPQLALGENDW
jgi:hypothetical protein